MIVETNLVKPRALILGVSGQDGSLLAKLLLDKGYEVWGSSRKVQSQTFENLSKLGIAEQVKVVLWSPSELNSITQIINAIYPDEIYNLSGQSSVGMSFANPAEAFSSVTLATHHLLEASRNHDAPVKIYNASSSECFGNTIQAATETTAVNPASPYAAAKACAFLQTANYREVFKLFCVSGILFNHESPLRPHQFDLQKVVQAAKRIADGSREKLELGDLSVIRDWGWAPEYVEGIWRMMQQTEPRDYILATGQSYSLEYLVREVFEQLHMDWREHVVINHAFKRPNEISQSLANPERAANELGWKAEVGIQELIKRMLNGTVN